MSFQIVAQCLLVVALFQGSTQAEMCDGCPVEFDPKEEGADKLLNLAFSTLNANSPDSLHLQRIVKATKQLVNGIKYTFDVEMVNERTNGVQECHIVLLSRPWISKDAQVLSQECQQPQVRTGRQLLGGLKDVDASEMGLVEELANLAASTLDQVDTDNNRLAVDQIIEAKKQLVNGIMYHLKLRLRLTNCPEDDSATVVSPSCGQSKGPRKLCSVQIYRSWADHSPHNAKVVKSECEDEPRHLVGGLQQIETNDSNLDRIVKFAVEHISQMTNSIYTTGLVGVVSAQSQVVAGRKYYLTIEVGDTNCIKNSVSNGEVCKVTPSNSEMTTMCDVIVWEKPWEKFTQVLSSECHSTPKHPTPALTKSRVVRAGLGGPTDLDPNDSTVKDAAQLGLNHFDATTNSKNRLGIGRIISATKKIVSGTEITIKMTVGESGCLKSEPVPNSGCVASNPTQVCTVTIWDRPWLGSSPSAEVTKTNCEPLRSKREARAGGVNEIDVNSPSVTKLLGFTERELTSRVNSPNTQKVVKVLGASKQIVAGTITKLKVEVADTDCLKEENKDPALCNPKDQDHQICTVTIWERKWLNDTSMTESDCHKKENTV